ncbi:hypothetical protein EIP91_012081 [Steccherinum ochraceum]|uniref:FAS1 domain-containing protein n=1 Tax=Steccherinum ochraceum TaxID=92696 RepID=A0A4R0RUC8_9APHY|nr:hypothetical protein EIP91_012081 [Steccherinum ochraceum]
MAAQQDQETLASPEAHDPTAPLTTPVPSLADLLTIEPSASIFYTYAREVELSELFADSEGNNTVLVPTNKAVMALSRKPHQGPAPVDSGVVITQQEYDRMSKENVERWVSAHIVPSHIGLPSSETYDTMLEGVSVTFHDNGGKDEPAWRRAVVNDNIHIVSMKKANNGVLYMIDGTVKID